MQISRGLAVTALCATMVISSAVGVTAKSMVPDGTVKQYPLHLFDAKGRDLGVVVSGTVPTDISPTGVGDVGGMDWVACTTNSTPGLHCYNNGLPAGEWASPFLANTALAYSELNCKGRLLPTYNFAPSPRPTLPPTFVKVGTVVFKYDGLGAKYASKSSLIYGQCVNGKRANQTLPTFGYLPTSAIPSVTYPLQFRAVG